MKYTIAAIFIAVTIMLILAYRSGGVQFALVMGAALAAISFCGMLPVLFAMRGRQPSEKPPLQDESTRIVVKDDDGQNTTLP